MRLNPNHRSTDTVLIATLQCKRPFLDNLRIKKAIARDQVEKTLPPYKILEFPKKQSYNHDSYSSCLFAEVCKKRRRGKGSSAIAHRDSIRTTTARRTMRCQGEKNVGNYTCSTPNGSGRISMSSPKRRPTSIAQVVLKEQI